MVLISLSLVKDYLGFWKRRSKTGSSFSDWANVIIEVLYKDLFKDFYFLILFNIFINDIFLFNEKFRRRQNI